MKNNKKQSGFSAVELLITLFIAAAFLISGYQLYAVVIKDGGEARMQSSASNVATDYLQRYKSSATNPCTVQAPLSDSPITVSGLSNVTATVAISCPPYTASATECTGGTVTHDGAYTVHKFTSIGTSTLACTSTFTADTLVVGGGGGGGSTGATAGGGGGGAGGVKQSSGMNLSGSISITVGNGGATQANGGPSSIGALLTANGGGGGGTQGGVGSNGASGGGGGGSTGARLAGGTGNAGEGYAGGQSAADLSGHAGGGGGAAGVGASDANGSNGGGLGGDGIQSSISGTVTWYGQGGEGGYGKRISTHGGGLGGQTGIAATVGAANTGGGGGGGYNASAPGNAGKDGGSGIVTIRYLTPVGSPITSISKISVTIEYGTPQKIITNATYVKP